MVEVADDAGAERVQQEVDGVAVDVVGEAALDRVRQRGDAADGVVVEQGRGVVADGDFDLALEEADGGVPEGEGKREGAKAEDGCVDQSEADAGGADERP